MKTKAYKLAAELGLQEQSVLEWLRAHGYPNVRRADTIRADVAQAARSALGGRNARREPPRPRPAGRSAKPAPRHAAAPSQAPAHAPASTPPTGFKTTFADLLEQHLPTLSPEAASAAGGAPDVGRTMEMAAPPEALRQAIAQSNQDEQWRRRIAQADRARAAAEAALAEAELGQRAAQAALNAARAQLAALVDEPARRQQAEADLGRVRLERSQLRQQLQAVTDERATLEATCTELQTETTELREAVERYETEENARQAMEGDLKQAKQRETAWRTRALELERAQQSGANLPTLLQSLGLAEPRQQAEVLRALLGHRDTAIVVLRAIEHVDAALIQKLVQQKVVETCAHALCNQVVAMDDRVAVRVESEKRCRVCQGSSDRRWFMRMARECGRAGVRRVLVIGGGDAVQAELRAMSEGLPVDLRLVADDDPLQPARVKGRVEGCDLLVLWSNDVCSGALPAAYAEAAKADRRGLVRVLGVTPRIASLARAVTHRLARDHVLRPL